MRKIEYRVEKVKIIGMLRCLIMIDIFVVRKNSVVKVK